MEAALKKTEFNFARYEKKYRLNEKDYACFLEWIRDKVHPDAYYESLICSIYYDTEDFQLIRDSLEKPIYKEKFRLRSYGIPDDNGEVFLEIKKKYKGKVYKRRVEMPLYDARHYLEDHNKPENKQLEDSQIFHEIDWFLRKYNVSPKAYIAYDRLSYVGNEDAQLRITFDRNIRYRTKMLDMKYGDFGSLIDQKNPTIMEIKFQNAVPLWLADVLNSLRIFPTSFSKYGQVYRMALLNNDFNDSKPEILEGGFCCA